MGAKSRGNFAHQPNPEWCCPGCIWPKEPHSDWCGKGKNATEFIALGMTVRVDPGIPRNTVRFVDGGRIVGEIVNIGKEPSVCHCQSARTVHASADGIYCGRCGGMVK